MRSRLPCFFVAIAISLLTGVNADTRDEKKAARLMSWAESSGIESKIEIVQMSTGNFGVRLKHSVAAGEVFLSIPSSLCLSASVARRTFGDGWWRLEGEPQSNKDQNPYDVALSLLVEKFRGTKSDYRAYIEM